MNNTRLTPVSSCMYCCPYLGDDTSLSLGSSMRTEHLCVLIHITNKGGGVPSNMFKPSSNFLLNCSKAVFLLWIIFCYLCFAFIFVLRVPCSLVVTCWEIADFFALLFARFSCVFVTFPYDVLGQVWYLIVAIPDICLLTYFYTS